MTKSLIKPKKV